MVVAFGVVVDSFIDLFGDDPNLAIRIHEGMRQAALSDVTFSATQVVVLQLIHIFLADNEHFGQVVFAFTHT